MSSASTEWVVYQAPKSVGFGHQSRVRDPRRAWPLVQRFLAELTRSTFNHHMELALWNSDGGTWRVEEARRILGPEAEDRGPKAVRPTWPLSEAQLPATIEFALDDDKFPKQQRGPSWLTFGYEFCW